MTSKEYKRMNKKIIAIIIGLVAIIAIALVGQLFNVKSVEVVYDTDVVLSTSSDDIVSLSQIEIGQNILTIDEKVAIDTIEEQYGNVIAVSSLERKFPNKVVIHLAVRDLLLAVNGTDDGAVETYATDQQFQVNSIKKSSPILDVDFDSLILVEGVSIDGTFNVPELKNVRNIIAGFYTLGYDNQGLKKLIKSISIDGDVYSINLREYEGSSITLTRGEGDLISTLSAKVDAFYALSDPSRYGKTL